MNNDITGIKSQLEQEATSAKTKAFEDILAGAPQINFTTEPTKQEAPPQSTRDEIMSNLNLMDHTYNYTDTYTNYINKGGTPPQGYEAYHQPLLEQERKEALFNNPDIDFDTALLDAYGRDVLRTMNMDVTSVAYWQNKYHSHDYSNPFSNSIIMGQVRTAALAQYNADNIRISQERLASSFSQAASLAGEELTGKQIKDIFGDLATLADQQNMTDSQLRNACLSGQIALSSRIIYNEDQTEAYYLHTDGQLHHLTEQNIRKDSAGNVTDISLNGSEFLDAGRHFVSSAANVFTGLYKLGGTLLVGAGSIILDGGDTTENIANFLNSTDAAINDSELTNWLTDSGHVDVDGFKVGDLSDWGMLLADLGGTIAGGMGLTSLASATTAAGAKLATTSTSAWVRTGGKLLQMSGNLAARSTGLYAGAKDVALDSFTIFGKVIAQGNQARLLNHALKTCTTYAVKDYYTTVQQLANNVWQTKAQNGEQMTAEDYDAVGSRALGIAGANYLVSLIFAGGINDDQTKRLSPFKETAEDQAFAKIIKEAGDSEVVKKVTQGMTSNKKLTAELMNKVSDNTLKEFLNARKNRIILNTAMDFIDNYVTTTTADLFGQVDKEDGHILGFFDSIKGDYNGESLWKTLLTKNIVQAAVMTGPTFKGNLESADYNVAVATLRKSWQEVLNTLDTRIAKAKNQEEIQTLKLVKQDAISTYNNTKGSAEEKIITTFDHLHSMLQSDGQSVVTKAITKAVNEDKIVFLRGIYEDAYNKSLVYREASNRFYQNIASKDRHIFREVITFIPRTVLKHWAGIEDGTLKTLFNSSTVANVDAISKMFTQEMDNNYATVGEVFDVLTGSSKSSKVLDTIKDKETIQDLTNSVEYINPFGRHVDLKELPVPEGETTESFWGTHTAIRIKNEASLQGGTLNDRVKASIMKTSLDLMAEDSGNSLIVKVNDEYYAVPTEVNNLTKVFTRDTIYKLNVGLANIVKGNTEGLELILTTILGDEKFAKRKYKKDIVAANQLNNILNVAIKNNVLDEGQVVSLMDTLLTKENISEDLSGAVEAFRSMITNVTESKYDTMNEIEKYYYVYTTAKELLKEYKENPKGIKSDKVNRLKNMFIDSSDENDPKLKADIANMLTTLIIDKKLKADDLKILEEFCNKGTNAVPLLSEAANYSVFRTVSQVLEGDLTEDEFIRMNLDVKYQDAIDEAKKKIADLETRINSFEEKDFKKKLRLVKKVQSLEEELSQKTSVYNKLEAELKQVYKLLISINNSTSQKDLGDNIVVFNGAKLYNDELRKVANQEARSTRSEKDFTTTTRVDALLKKHSDIFNTQIKILDLNEARDIEVVRNILLDLELVTKDTPLNTAQEIKRAIYHLDNDDIIHSAGTQTVVKGLKLLNREDLADKILNNIKNIKDEKVMIDKGNKKASKIDVYNAVRNSIDLSDLSEEMVGSLKDTEDIKILPYDGYKDTELLEEPERFLHVVRETDEKSGKVGGTAGSLSSTQVTIFKETVATKMNKDHDLSMKFALLKIIETMADDDSEAYSFIVPISEEANNLQFFNKSQIGENKLLLTLDKTKVDDMKKYIVSNKEINLFEIIPLITSEHSTNVENYIKQFDISSYKGEAIYLPDVSDDNAGLHQRIDALLNIRFAWDVDNSIKQEIFMGLFAKANKGEFNYNVFSSKNKPSEFEGSYEDYTKKIINKEVKDLNNPVGKLLDLYNKEIPRLLKGDGSGDYKVWMLDNHILRYVTDVYNKGGIKAVKKLTAENIKDMYTTYRKSQYTDSSDQTIIDAPVYVNKGDIDTPYTSGDIILEASGKTFELIDDSGKFYADDTKVNSDIEKALDTIVELIGDYENDIIHTDTGHEVMYRDSNNMNFAASVAGHHGYITIEDLDYLIDMEFDFFRKLFDGTNLKTSEIRAEFDTLKKLSAKIAGIHDAKKNISYTLQKSVSGASMDVDKVVVDENNLDTPEAIEAAHVAEDLAQKPSNYERDTTRLKRLTDFNLNDLKTLERDMLENLDSKISSKYMSQADREVLNITNTIGKHTQFQIIKNTINTVEGMFSEVESEIPREKAITLSKELMDIAGGTKGENLGYVVVDKTTGDIVEQIPKSSYNSLEVHSKLSNIENLKDKLFLSVDNHDLKSNDGIKFSYVNLDTDKAIEDLKISFLEDGIKASYNIRDMKIHGDKSFDEYMSYLKNLPEEELAALLNSNERMQMSRKTNNEFIVNVISALTNIENKDYVADTIIERKIGNPFYKDNSVNNYLNRTNNDLRSDNYYEREQAGLATYGQTYTSLDEKQSRAEASITNSFNKVINNSEAIAISKELNKYPIDSKEFKDTVIKYWNNLKGDNEEFSLPYEDKLELIAACLNNIKNAQNLSYKTNKNLKLSQLNDNPESYNKISIKDFDNTSEISLKELQDILNGSNNKRIHLIDFEGVRTSGNVKASLKEAFQLAIKTLNGDGEAITKQYFITHKGISPDALDNEYKITDSDFHKNNKGYRDAWAEYTKAFDEDSDLLIKEEDVHTLFNEGDIVLAFNGNNYDFLMLKEALGEKSDIKCYDVIDIAAAIDDNAVTHKMDMESLAAKYSDVVEKHGNAHNAFDDVNVMEDLTKQLVENGLNFEMNGKKTVLEDVNTLAKLLGISDEDLPKLYTDIDNIFKGDESFKLDSKLQLFKQEFMDTSDTSKILRLLNFLERNDIGKTIRDFEQTEMYKQLGVDTMIKGFIQGGADNIVTALAHIRMANKEMSTSQALDTLIRIGYSDKEIQSAKHMIEALSDKDILNKLPGEVDYSSDEFQSMKKAIRNNLEQDIFIGIKDDKNGLGISAEEIRNWKKTGNVDTAIRSMHKAVRGLNLQKDIQELVVRNMLTPTTSSNGKIEDYQVPKVLNAENKLFKSIQEATQKYNASETLLIEPKDAQYNMIAPFSLDQDITEYYRNDAGKISTRKVTDAEASDILLTRQAAEDIFGTNIENIFDESGEAYVFSLAYPSAYANHLMAHKVRIIEGTGTRIFLTPITQKILRARDFDGDFIPVWGGLTEKQKAIAKENNKYVYRQFTLQEKLYDFVKGLNKSKANGKAIFAYEIGSTNTVLEQSFKLDALLEKRAKAFAKDPLNTKVLSDLDAKIDAEELILENTIAKAVDEYNKYGTEYISTKDAIELLGLHKGSSHDTTYIKNPILINNPKNDNGDNTYSYTSYYNNVLKKAATKDLTGDSMSGYFKKWKQFKATDETKIDLPLKQLGYTDIVIAGELSGRFTDIVSGGNTTINKYFDLLSGYISELAKNEDLNSSEFSEAMNILKNEIETERIATLEETDTKTQELKLSRATMVALTGIEVNIRSNRDFNNRLLEVLTKYGNDTSYEDSINHRKEIRDIFHSKENRRIIYGDNEKVNNYRTSLFLSKIHEDYNETNNTQYLKSQQDLYKTGTCSVAVCLDDLDAEDQIIWNTNSSKKVLKVYHEHISSKDDKQKIQQNSVLTGKKINKILGTKLDDSKSYIITRVTRNSEGYVKGFSYAEPEMSLENIKVLALSKGVAIGRDGFEDNGIDAIVSGAGFKDFEKYVQALGRLDIESEIKEFSIPGESTKKRFKIVHNVPLHALIDDSEYDKSTTKNFEFMAVPGNMDTTLGIAVFDSMLYDVRGKNELYRNYSKIAPLITKENGTSINWNTAVPAIQSIRANIIADALDHFNLWHTTEKIIKNPALRNKDAWLNDVSKNFNICTKEFNTMLGSLIKAIGIENFGNYIATQNSFRAAMFGEEISKQLSSYIPGEMYAFTDKGKQITLTSKNKAAQSLRRYIPESPGEKYNTTEKTLGAAVRHAEDYYIPMSELYKALGIYINKDDVIDGTANRIFGRGKHSESALSNNFKPVNEIFKLEDNYNISDNVNNNALKNGTAIDPTSSLYSRLYGISYNESGDNAAYLKDLFGEIDDPTLETALYDNLTSDSYKYSYNRSKTMLGYMLYQMYNKNNHSSFDKLSAILNRNISKDINLNVAKRIKTMQDGTITSTIHPIHAKVDFNQLKSKELEDLSTSLSNYGFYTFRDVKNNLDTTDKNKGEVKKAISNIEDKKAEFKNAYRDKILKVIDFNNIKENIIPDKNYDKNIRFTFDSKPTTSPFKDSLVSRSGFSVTTPDEMQADVIVKNYASAAEMYKVDAMNKFNSLKSVVNSKYKQDFENLCIYTMYKLAEKNSPEQATAILKYTGATNMEAYKQSADKLIATRPDIVRNLNNFFESVKVLSNKAAQTTGEEFGNLMQIIAPFVPANKELTKQVVYGNLKRVGVINSEANFNKYDPSTGAHANMIFNFFDSAPVMIDQLSKVAAMQQFSDGLLKYGLIDNTKITDKVFEYLNENIDVNALYTKKFDSTFYTIQNTIYDTVTHLTDLDIRSIIKNTKNPIDTLRGVYKALSDYTENLRVELVSDSGEVYTFSELGRLSQTNPDNVLYAKAYNAMKAQLICAQRLTEISPNILTNVESYLAEINEQGLALCNKFGQKISMDTPFKPIAESSLKYISDNIELYANSSDPKKFTQYLIERALCGELYTANANMIDQFDKRVYTKKVPNKIEAFLKEISKASSSIQMALPAKLVSRLLRFTGFDYIMGLTYNPKVAPEIIQAGKEISQAIYSKGESITEDSLLYQYLIREGQPIGQTGKDPVTFSEDINKSIASVTDKLTEPLQYQNHLGRYAIWLAAYKSFEKGDPWYGPVYHHKAEIDALGNTKEANYDKAMYIMDYMLGSPGGFPNVSKSTSGYLMYATFPMNLTRTMGAYGMSLKALAEEGITPENAPHWMKSVVSPTASLLIMNYLSSAIISAVCDMYDIDEETEEEWIKEGVTIDPLGTAIGGTPSVVYDSLLPNKNLKEMFLNPLTSEYNPTITDKSVGLLNSTILSKLNPAIKTPIEIVTRKDLYGSSPIETRHKYTNSENVMRKVLGFVLGSGVANSIIDQYKMDEYDTDSTFASSLKKGFIKGFSSDLGNQKTWKKDTSNYYSVIDSIKDFKNSNGETYESSFNSDEYYSSDYARVSAMAKKMIHNKVDATTLYAYIISEYNSNVDINTLRSVLNNNSVIRKLNTIDKKAYYNTLTDKELQRVAQAIRYEQEVYPFLETMFPYESYDKYKYKRYNYYNRYGSGGGGYGSGSYYPKSYYPKIMYPSNYYSNSKYNSYSPKIYTDRVEVNVSPQMAVWKNNYNSVKDPKKEEWYLNNSYYNNLSDYEKRKLGGN